MSIADTLRNQPAGEDPTGKGRLDLTSDEATISNVVLEEPIADDWTPVFKLFKLDAAEFEVVDDTVKMSTWQQSKGLDDGTRDVVQLYSYSARFRRVSKSLIPAATLVEWRKALIVNEPPQIETAPSALPATYVMLIADPQLGKKGTAEAVENWKRGVLGHIAIIQAMQAIGRGPEAIHVAFMGDETEGVANNYTNQPHTIELNLAQQLELDFDMRVWTFKEVAKLGLAISSSSVHSNHGAWTRNGGKEPITTNGDNASTHIARQAKKLFAEIEPYGGPKIDWTIGEGDPAVTATLSGVDCYFSHGYIEKGRGTSSETRTRGAIERQILGRTDTLGTVPLWFMAHYHHHYSNEFEGRSLFGCPALEAERSSEYMLNQYGVWSPPGMLGMLVGTHTTRKWSDLTVI